MLIHVAGNQHLSYYGSRYLGILLHRQRLLTIDGWSSPFSLCLDILMEAKLKMSQNEVLVTADLWVNDARVMYQGLHLQPRLDLSAKSNLFCEHCDKTGKKQTKLAFIEIIYIYIHMCIYIYYNECTNISTCSLKLIISKWKNAVTQEM